MIAGLVVQNNIVKCSMSLIAHCRLFDVWLQTQVLTSPEERNLRGCGRLQVKCNGCALHIWSCYLSITICFPSMNQYKINVPFQNKSSYFFLSHLHSVYKHILRSIFNGNLRICDSLLLSLLFAHIFCLGELKCSLYGCLFFWYDLIACGYFCGFL